MKNIFVVAVCFAALIVYVCGEDCGLPGGAYEDNNAEDKDQWYCEPVEAMSFGNWNYTGSYMPFASCLGPNACTWGSQKEFGGPLAPLDKEVSFVFRGPLRLKQFAVYQPAVTQSKRDASPVHGHGKHHHGKHVQIMKNRDVGDVVIDIMDGQVVSWINVYGGPSADSTTAAATATSLSSIAQVVPSVGATTTPAQEPVSLVISTVYTTLTITAGVDTMTPASSSDAGPDTSTSLSSSMTPHSDSVSTVALSSAAQAIESAMPSAGASIGSYNREAYYDAESQQAEGLLFANHEGGGISEKWTQQCGNTQSYMASDGVSAAPGPQTLADNMLPDTTEIIILSNRSCTNGDCGVTAPGGVAYHGFEGGSKVFLMEFSMPLTGKRGPPGSDASDWKDMPAVWLLNTEIVNAYQYGCSCWRFGCGELDLFETLSEGNVKMKATFHGNSGASTANWFSRPVDDTIKAAVVFDTNNSAIHIKILPNDTDFSASLSADTIKNFSDTSKNGTFVNVQPPYNN